MFIDEVSGFRSVYFMRHKSDVASKFKEFKKMVRNKFEISIKVIRCDNCTEYINKDMRSYLTEKGIQMKNSPPYTPEKNGKSKRENRTIVETARTMLKAKNLPDYLWAETVNTAVYLRNRTSSRKIPEKTPFEMWNGVKPNVKHLKIFSSDAYVHIPKQFRHKLDSK